VIPWYFNRNRGTECVL